MELTEEAKAKLNTWLCTTWHTSHLNDMERWYSFVDQYDRDTRSAIDDVALREIIQRMAGIEPEDPRVEVIRERISLAIDIRDFLRHTGRSLSPG